MSSSKLQLLSYCLLLTACSTFAPEPTATPSATATNTPVPTATATHTPEPTATDTPLPPTDTPEPPIDDFLQETPAAEWRDIPIMPEATAAQAGSFTYFYHVDASMEEVFAFYDQELGDLGYTPSGWSENNDGSIFVLYSKGSESISITAILQDDGSTVVLIL